MNARILMIKLHYAFPGAVPVISGHVRIEVTTIPLGPSTSQDSLVRELALSLSAQANAIEKTIFLTPL